MQLQIDLLEQAAQYQWVAGVDEAGRGPLAGEVVAAAVILDSGSQITGLDDSKKLSEARREHCYQQIIQSAASYAIGRASVQEIDEINILRASLLAMGRAVDGLAPTPEFVFVDGNVCPSWNYRSAAIVKGDARLECVAAASILAKVTRDRDMKSLESVYPGYGFARHKGYPTRDHLIALEKLGPCAAHRRSFKPVAELL